MGKRELLFSVTLKDCEVQHFRSGGKGGQNQNKRDTGTRVIHHPSGARGESREERSQLQNTKTAFRRMAATGTFRAWVNREIWGHPLPPEEQAERDMDPSNLLIMARERCYGCGHPDCGQECCIHDDGTGGEGHLRWKIID